MNELELFLQKAEQKSFSKAHRERIQFNMKRYHEKVVEGKKQFQDLDLAKKVAKNRKWEAIENLPRLLLEFEKKISQRGAQVIWAENIQEAQDAIKQIIKDESAQTVVKSKSMITEEIKLNDYLKQLGVEVIETDLGEFIVQVKGEKPYHIVTPAMHLSKNDIATLFEQEFGTARNATAEELTHFVRKRLQEKFYKADIGITGANFMVAETGSLVLVENEGNARLVTTCPKVHVAIVGIEKMLSKISDLDLFLPLLATHGTGQKLTVYNSIISGPKQVHETDGPEKMYVILLDNGRTELLEDIKQREALYCIRCGACLNNCPVYQNIGGHTYNSPYSGPIGAVISPNLHIKSFEDYAHLSHASSLCGSCTESCPVNIDIHKMLLYNRALEEEWGLHTTEEKRMWMGWKQLMLNRNLMNAPSFSKNWFANLFLTKKWGNRRVFPKFPKKSFNQLWKSGQI